MSKNATWNHWPKPRIKLGYRLIHYSGDIPVNRLVVCAATRYGDVVIPSARHHDPLMHQTAKLMGVSRVTHGIPEQGFIDQFGVFMDRKEALAIAVHMGQVNVYRPKSAPYDALFSEDLY